MKREKNKKQKGGSKVTKGGDYKGNAGAAGFDLDNKGGTHSSLGASNVQNGGETQWYAKGNQWGHEAGSKSKKGNHGE